VKDSEKGGIMRSMILFLSSPGGVWLGAPNNTNPQKIVGTPFLGVFVCGRISRTFAPEKYLSEMRKILLPAEAGKLVRRDRRTIIDWIKRRACPARTLPSGQYILFEDEFLAWLEQQGCR
jgi:hypothetical protein